MAKPLLTIVGAGPGVGMGVARRFSQAGYRIALVARNISSLAQHQAALERLGIEASAFEGDASREESLVNAFRGIHEEIGHTEVLLYNAAAVSVGDPLSLSLDALLHDFQVNIAGAVIAVRQVASSMKDARRGTILLTGGGFSLYPQPDLFSLGLGKAGIRNLTVSLAASLEPHGIRVGTVTIMGAVKEAGPLSPDAIAEEFFTLHSQKPGSPNEIQFRGD